MKLHEKLCLAHKIIKEHLDNNIYLFYLSM